MDGSIGVGILGMGAIGHIHAAAINTIPGVRVTAFTTSRRGGDLKGAARCASAEALLGRADVDVVAVCSPSAEHAGHAALAIDRGKHVVIEKPPAGSAAELSRLAEQARARNVLISIVSQQRLRPHPRYIAGLLHSGQLGRPLIGEIRLHWYRSQSYYNEAEWRSTDPHAGSLANQGWHALDLLNWLYGPVDCVCAMTATLAHRIDVEDTTSATLRFRNGALGSVVTTTAIPPGRPGTITLFTERAHITIRNSIVERWDVPDNVPPPPTDRETPGGAADPASIGAAGHRQVWCDMIGAIRDHRPPAVTASDGASTVALIEAIYAAARTGTVVAPWSGHGL